MEDQHLHNADVTEIAIVEIEEEDGKYSYKMFFLYIHHKNDLKQKPKIHKKWQVKLVSLNTIYGKNDRER